MDLDGKSVVVRSFAKVNLTLDVLGKRPDGYHAIESVMQTVSLHDTVSLSLGGSSGIRLTCDADGIPTDARNLAHRAASAVFEASGVSPGLEIAIEKRIPAEAGLGGGSSNAAAVLRGLGLLLELSRDDVFGLAAQVGSDVPFFMVGGTAQVSGRGEYVHALPEVPEMWIVVVKPPFGISTPWAYRRLDEVRAASGQPTPDSERGTASMRMVECVRSGSPVSGLHSLVHSDLEPPAMEQHPDIAEMRDALRESGARAALLCGSGSAVFGLFEDESQARSAECDLSDRSDASGSAVFVARTVGREEALDID